MSALALPPPPLLASGGASVGVSTSRLNPLILWFEMAAQSLARPESCAYAALPGLDRPEARAEAKDDGGGATAPVASRSLAAAVVLMSAKGLGEGMGGKWPHHERSQRDGAPGSAQALTQHKQPGTGSLQASSTPHAAAALAPRIINNLHIVGDRDTNLPACRNIYELRHAHNVAASRQVHGSGAAVLDALCHPDGRACAATKQA